MKIAILTSGFLPVPAVQGGAVENLIDMYLAYNDRCQLHDITVYSASHAATSRHPALSSSVNHYRYINMSSPLAKVLKYIHKMTKGNEYYHYSIEYYFEKAMAHIRHQDYDLIIVENRPGYVLKLARQTSARIVCHLHNDVLNADTPYAVEICRAASLIVTVSHYLSSRVSAISTAAGKCVTVHNGIDLNRFSLTSARRPERSDYSLSASDFVLVFTGRVIPEKGIAQLLDAMLLLKDQHHIKLLVVGSPFYANATADNEFIAMLKQKVATLPGRILFTGFVPYPDIPSVLTLADAAVLPSVWHEPLGMTCIEAMAMGLPVITTRQGGIPETVSDECAVLLPVDDRLAERLAQSILQLCNDRERCERMRTAAVAQASRFSSERFARHFFQELDKLA